MTNPSTVEVTDAAAVEDDDLVEEELLVEEISIDGMCGVY
jgi:mycofactocin precursor